MSRTEIRITGFGGQGVVLSGFIIGRAYAVHAGNNATMMQSFGPEARGSACSATIVASEDEVLYPYVMGRTDIFVAMSADGYETYRDELQEDGILLYEKDLVTPKPKPGQHAFGIPSTRLAEQVGRVIVQNIVMLGFFAAATSLASRDELRDAVKASVPAGTEDLNLRAFDAGYRYFEENYGATGTAQSSTAQEERAHAVNGGR